MSTISTPNNIVDIKESKDRHPKIRALYYKLQKDKQRKLPLSSSNSPSKQQSYSCTPSAPYSNMVRQWPNNHLGVGQYIT